MNDVERDAIFKAQTENVRELERTWKQINRQINTLILAKNETAVVINTKVLLLIYCALAEATFSKLIHTPNGLLLEYIDQVKEAWNGKNGNLMNGWLKCSELAIQSIQGAKSNHGHNVRQKLDELIERFIFDPSLLRNKLAHGQWCVALNRENTRVNTKISDEIKNYTVVELYRKKSALEKLAAILEDIIESPNKAHHRDYWEHLEEFQKNQQKMEGWTMQEKIDQLFIKKSRAPLRKELSDFRDASTV